MENQIIIEVRGGVANVVKKCADVELIIQDFDVSDEEGLQTDEGGHPYMEEVYIATNFWDESDPN